MNFIFWEKPKVEIPKEKILEDANAFIQNFNKNLKEAQELLDNSGSDPDQSVLDQISSRIIDMNSNLKQLEETMRLTTEGRDYLIAISNNGKDSLERIHQSIVLGDTPFAAYPQMKIDFERFKRESAFKLNPVDFDEGYYQE